MKYLKIVGVPGEIRITNLLNMNKSLLLWHIFPVRQFPSSHM